MTSSTIPFIIGILLSILITGAYLEINSKATRMDEKVGLMMLRYDSILERIKIDSERCERAQENAYRP